MTFLTIFLAFLVLAALCGSMFVGALWLLFRNL